MSAVSNQLPYTKIEPLPIPSEGYPRLYKLFSRVILTAVVTGSCTALGFGVGLSSVPISIMTGTVCGGIVGLIVSIVLSFLIHVPSRLSQYRLNTLKQIKETSKNPKILKALEHLEEFFYYPFLSFSQMYQHHYLQHAFSEVSMRLDRDIPNGFKVWIEFLKGLDKTKVRSPDGETIEFDMGIQLERLQGKSVSIEVEPLHSYWNKPIQKDLEEIEKLQKLCFGKSERFSLHGGKGLVARRKETKEILGFIWYHEKDGGVRISGLGRHPGATHLRIGGQLIHHLLSQLKSSPPISVVMRQNNPAAHLFSKWGFEKEKDLPKYYLQGPAESGVLMKLDWEKFRKITSQ